MKITVNTTNVPKLADRLWKTEPGRLAMLIDEMLYSAQEVPYPGAGLKDTKLLALWTEVSDRTKGYKDQDSKKVLAEIRDYLYRISLEGIL